MVSNSGAYLGIVHVLSCAAQYKRRGPAHSLLSLVYTHFFFQIFVLFFTSFTLFFVSFSLSLTHAFSPLVRAGVCACVCYIFFLTPVHSHSRAPKMYTDTHAHTCNSYNVSHLIYIIYIFIYN